MLHALNNWIKNLILVVLLAGFIQILVPGEPFKRYIRVVMGFFIIITLLNPLLAFLQLDLEGEIPWPYETSSSFRDIQQTGEDLRYRGEEELVHVLQQERKREIEGELLARGFPLFTVLVSIGRRGEAEVFLSLSSSEKTEERQKIEQRLYEFFWQFYHLPASRVHIEWNEG